MNAKIFGATIAALRRKKGYTQADLAERLSLSNKTVSKWENGQGYPDITTLPALAKLFGVTVDELLSEEKSGIAVAGTVLVDTPPRECLPTFCPQSRQRVDVCPTPP